jgi:hypothetical protein
MPELWVPGAAGPSLEDFVQRLNAKIGEFARRRDWPSANVEVELHDGSTFQLHSISPEPGYGLVTLCPYPEDGSPWPGSGDATPEEVIVPVGSIMRITLSRPEDRRSRFGFAPPGPAP